MLKNVSPAAVVIGDLRVNSDHKYNQTYVLQ